MAVSASVLFCFYIIILNLSHAVGDTLPAAAQPRTFSCSGKFSDGHIILSCEGHTRIPTLNDDSGPVTVLDMSKGNHLQTVKSDEFKNADLLNLKIIKLQNCQIRTVERGAFRDLDSVVEIDLRNNNIDSWDLETFEVNNNLQHLFLSGNPIHQFVGTQFAQLPNLKKIDFSNCKISKVPIQAFKKLTKLQELDLRSNRLHRLDWNTFENVNSLTHIFLDNNEWHCDCHTRFLQTYLSDRKINIANSVVCTGPDKFANMKLSAIPQEALTCHPQITGIASFGGAEILTQGDNAELASDDLIIYSEAGRDIGLQCAVDAFPEPNIIWMRNGRPITSDYGRLHTGENTENSNGNDVEKDFHYKIMDVTTKISDMTRPEFQYQFTKLLTIYNISRHQADYECIANNIAGQDAKKVYFNFTNVPQDEVNGDVIIVTKAGSRTWLWILIAVLILLFIALVTMCILIWRRRDNQRQLKYRQEMLDKFKGSEIVIDDTFAGSKQPNNSSMVSLLASNPMKSNTTEVSSARNSILPDVAQGGGGINSDSNNTPSLSPVVFSPRPPQSSDLRRQFFAAQEQQPSSRPGGALSFVYNNGPAARQFPGHPQLYSNRIHDARLAHLRMATRRPWGSSQSLVHHPEYYGGGPRPVLTRQFSGPAYATMRIPPREQRPLPNMWEMNKGGPGYVTLPRNFTHSFQQQQQADSGCPSVSPTESSYSMFSYTSTLPRRNPANVIYDSVGPRTTVDGGSNVSLNKIGSESKIDALDSISYGLASPTRGKIRPGRSRSVIGTTPTPGSIRGRNDFFSFEPIAEVDGSEQDLGTVNCVDDPVLPKLQVYPQNHEAKYKKKKPPPLSAIPLRSRKPIRTFQYSKLEPSNGHDYDASLDGDKVDDNNIPDLPATPIPSADRLKSSIENIIEVVEGTEV